MTKDEVIDLIRDTGFGFLATVEGDQPRVRPMMPYLTEDGEFLLALLGRSRTIPQVQANGKVEFCFVDRKMWYARVSGKATVSEERNKKEILWNNIPMLRQYFGGIDDPNFHLVVINVASCEAMTPHQKNPETVSLN